MVYYLKYRPQTISTLDLDSVREKLTSVLKKGDVPHAFLFSGPKGLGKTSAARILAKAINCKTKKGIEPCNICVTCVAITNGSHIDVLEIDAASNRGIDEIRELRDKIKYSPSELTKKIYIIDEVHMLTTEAFNALLKTLEEPPDHAVFILATTEPWKLLPTIVSRTFEVKFEKPTTAQISSSLARIIKGEKLEVEDGVLNLIAEMSDGAFRDAAKHLEEASVSSNGSKITKKILDELFKTGTINQEVEKLILSLSKKDAKESLIIIEQLAGTGVDFKLVIEQLAEKFRKLLLESVGISQKTNSASLTTSDLQRLTELINEAYGDLKTSVLPQLPLELVVIKWCILEQDQKSEIKDQKETISLKSQEKDKLNSTTVRKQPENNEPMKQFNNQKTVFKQEEKKDPQLVRASNNSDFLYQLIDAIKHENAQIAGLLRGCFVEELTDSKVTIVTKFQFHGEKLKESKTLAILESKTAEILGRELSLSILVKN